MAQEKAWKRNSFSLDGEEILFYAVLHQFHTNLHHGIGRNMA